MATSQVSSQLVDTGKVLVVINDQRCLEPIAKEYLQEPEGIRLLGRLATPSVTGTYRGERLSFVAIGNGMASAALYLEELLRISEAELVIRVGPARRLADAVEHGSIIITQTAYAENNTIINDGRLPMSFAPAADFDLLWLASSMADTYKYPNKPNCRVGNTLTIDRSSQAYICDHEAFWAKKGILAADLETAAVYAVATEMGKKALSLSLAARHVAGKEEFSPDGLSDSAKQAITLGLDIAAMWSHKYRAES